MRTIKDATTYEMEIKKSKFICYIDTVHSVEDANEILKRIEQKYKDATHYCYAYIIDTVKRFQDDGEPGGTAGMPILHVLESQNLQHIIAIVIRYFGGIKLGAGGLVRAYSNAVSEALMNSQFTELTICKKVSISFSYESTKKIDYIIQDYFVINKKFDNIITYELIIPNHIVDSLIQSLQPIINSYTIEDNIVYKK